MDADSDGDIDFIVGNLGNNSSFKASSLQPLTIFVNDFNKDGRIDPVMTWYVQNKPFPFNSRDEITGQLPALNKKFLHYSDDADATIDEMFSAVQIRQTKKFYIHTTQSSLLINKGNHQFELQLLPLETQFSILQ